MAVADASAVERVEGLDDDAFADVEAVLPSDEVEVRHDVGERTGTTLEVDAEGAAT